MAGAPADQRLPLPPSAAPLATLAVPTAEAMRALGVRLGTAARAGDLLLLEGTFGAGKTTLVQGLAAGLGVEAEVTSPSFVLENQHHGRMTLYHVDLYRLAWLDPAFLEEIEEHLFGDGVAAVEWPHGLPEEWRREPSTTVLTLRETPDGAREVEIVAAPPHLLAALAAGGPATERV